jgi:hypothetical protein
MRVIRKSLLAVALLFLALLCIKVFWVWHYSVAGRELLALLANDSWAGTWSAADPRAVIIHGASAAIVKLC